LADTDPKEGCMTPYQNGITVHLRDFIGRHAAGWGHADWLELLADLGREGLDTTDPDRIGLALERERLRVALDNVSVKGLGPKRRDALIERFGSLSALKEASIDEVANLPAFHRGLAEAVRDALR
jgi:hypothetical protein